MPAALDLGADGPSVDTMVLKEALLRVGKSFLAGDHQYPALEAYMEKRPPTLRGRAPAQPIVANPKAPLPDIIEAVQALDHSYLFIQGPPGAGKTYTGSHVIAALLVQGKRVAVSSNSHKAINNLLAAVEAVMLARGHTESCMAKKCSKDEHVYPDGQLIVNVESNDHALQAEWQLVAGTAWLFARPSRAAVRLPVHRRGGPNVARQPRRDGPCARNIVLLGDQMQLSQPIQGVHPGRSGESSLRTCSTSTRRCRRARHLFADRRGACARTSVASSPRPSRALTQPKNANQTLILDGATPRPAPRNTGIVFWPMDHVGCSQKSAEEAAEIGRIYTSLLQQSW